MTPSGHFLKAVALMERVDDMRDPCLPIAKALTAQAAVHAALAQCKHPPAVINVRGSVRDLEQQLASDQTRSGT